jgi:hypothetical protein
VDEEGRLQPGVLAAGGGRCFVADERVPVVAEIDAGDGRVVALHTWPLSPPHRRLPTATQLALQGDDLLVASPAAGGVVRIDRSTGAAAVVRVPLPPLCLVVDGDAVWIVGALDLDDDAEPDHDGTRHPVRWVEPTAEDAARLRSRTSGWFAYAPGTGISFPPADDAPLPTAAEWQDQDDDEDELVDRGRRLYRLAGDDLVAVDLGGEPCGAVALDGALIGVCWRDDDPLVKRVDVGGWLAFERPASVVHVSPDGEVRRLGAVDDNGGHPVVDGGRVWLLGYRPDDEPETARELRPDGGGLGDPVEPGLDQLLTVVGGTLVGVHRGDLHLVPLDGAGAPRRAAAPDVGDDEVGVDGGTVWLLRRGGPGLVGVDVAAATVRELPLAVDCAHLAPEPTPPPGLDLAAYERRTADGLRSAFLGSLVDEDGNPFPYIPGITFDDVRLEGTFPAAAVVGLFHAEGYPGVQFGRRWRLYDELGDPSTTMEYADVYLMEDIESGDGLPAPEDCVPDAAGIVWFQ